MNFLKDHFEKLILGLVLLLSVGGIAFVIQQISSSKVAVDQSVVSPRGSVKEYEDTDLQAFQTELNAISQEIEVGITGEHELLNPVRWQDVGGRPRKTTELGIKKLSINDIKPLSKIVRYVRTTDTGRTVRYVLEMTDESAESVGKRKPTKRTFEIGKPIKGIPYILERVEGSNDRPSRIALIISDEDTGVTERVTFTPESPYRAIVGYSASFYHEPSNKTFADQRVSDTLKINDSSFDIVAITKNQATLENKSGKRTTLDFNNNR